MQAREVGAKLRAMLRGTSKSELHAVATVSDGTQSAEGIHAEGGSASVTEVDAGLRRFLALLFADGGLREVRALDVVRSSYPHKTEHVEAGYFRPEDLDALIWIAGHYRLDEGHFHLPFGGLSILRQPPKGVYVSLNPIKSAAYAKAPARMVVAKHGETSSDVDVEHRTTLLIDVDSPRAVTGVSATEAEKAQAEMLTDQVRQFLVEQGWPQPIVIDSGNGYQILFRIDLPADDEGLVERVLKGLAAKFPRQDGGIDVSVHNAARIARLPSTWNRKGHSIDDRPHRLAQVLSLPDSFCVVPIEKLQQVADLAPKAAPPEQNGRARTRKQVNDGPGQDIDAAVVRWNADHPRTFPTHASPCPICSSPDGLKACNRDSSRWTCFSSRHDLLGADPKKGAGLQGNGCFTGDSLDIEAWARGCTRIEILQEDGYLKKRRRKQQDQPVDVDTPEGDQPTAGKSREVVYYHRTDGDVPLHMLAPSAVRLLAEHAKDDIYVHAGSLAHVVTAPTTAESTTGMRRSAAPRIRPYPASVLRERLDAVAQWMYEWETESGETRGEERWCPREIVNAVRDRGEWPGLRELSGVTSAPVLRADLTVLNQSGYDNTTGLLYVPSCEYQPVPESPSSDDVARAVAELRVPFADFPIVGPADHAALLAYILTLAARPAIRGGVPMTGITARVPGTGKTLLVDSATLAMTGHLPDKLMVPGGRSSDADAEWRKRIATLAMEGARAVLIDNVADGAMLQSSALAAALTAEELTERLLATNRTVRVPHRIAWTFSGNNVTVAADLARRSLSIALDAKVEDPHLRSAFRIENLLQHVRDEHPRLLVAALTILRGFAVAGCPKHGGPMLGMFEAWDELIRACVIWAINEDPVDTQARLRGESPETGNLGMLLIAWRDAIGVGRPVQAADLLRTPALASALSEATPGRGERDLPSSKSLGHYLRRNEGRVVGGLRIERVGASTGVTLWTIRGVTG